RELAGQLLSMQAKLEIAGLPLLLRRLVSRPFVGAAVPQDDASGAVIPTGNGSLKVAVVQRMIFHVHGQAFNRGVKGGAVGQRPGLEDPVHFQPQVIVETSCAMSLNKKALCFALSFFGGGLGSARENSFSPVFF